MIIFNKMSQDDAINFLTENKDSNIPIYRLISGRSWTRKNQKILADLFLDNIPYANSYAYQCFLSIMTLDTFIFELKKHLSPTSKGRFMVFKSHLKILFTRQEYIKTDDLSKIENFFIWLDENESKYILT